MTNIEIKARSIYDSLNNAEKRVASYFLANPEKVFSLPIARLADESQVSQVAWVRFCKAIGFDGLKDMKKSLFAELHENAEYAGETEPELFADIAGSTTVEQMIHTVQHSSIQAIEDTLTLLSPAQVEEVARRVLAADSIKLFGVAASALVAEDLFDKLLRIGKNVCFCRDIHIQLTYAANAAPGDVALFFSNSGATKEVLECLDLAKKNGCYTVGVSRFLRSPLAARADTLLYTSSPEVYRRSGAMSSRIAQLMVVDVLFTAIAKLDYGRVERLLENSYESCRGHRVTE